MFRIDDMLAILFPHMFEDVEFLLPPDEDVHMEDGIGQANAVAGPSRQRWRVNGQYQKGSTNNQGHNSCL